MKISSTFEFQSVQGFKFGSTLFGKPSMYSHLYFIDGLLIDTGHSNMRRAVFKAVKDLPVEQICITHHHEDHTGNLGLLQKHFACPSYATAECVELMKKPPSISFAQWLTWGIAPPNNIIEVIGNQVNTPQFQFQVIPIPGHAIDMIALYEPRQGWLFSADLWVYHYIRIFMRAESMRQQIASIKKILQLDFEVLFCSHNPQLKGGKQLLEKKLLFLEDFYGQVADLYHKGLSLSGIFTAMELKESWPIRILSHGALSTKNMVKSVIRDEQHRVKPEM